MKKKIVALVLLAALLFNSLGSLGLLLAAHHHRRAHVRAAVERAAVERAEAHSESAREESESAREEAAHLVEIVVPRTAPQRGAPQRGAPRIRGGELQYRGVMYDLVRVERGAHETRYLALVDEHDTAYFSELSKFMDARRADGAERPERGLSSLEKIYDTLPALPALWAPVRRLLSSGIARVRVPAAPFLAVPVPPPWGR